jgi:hypothetical protein
MSTSTPHQQHTTSQPTHPLIFAIGGAVTAAVLTGYGTFKGGDHYDDLPEFFGNLAIIVAATVLVYAVFVRRALHSDGARAATRTASVLAMLAVATIIVFYLGLDVVLASGAVCTALAANHRAGRWTTATRVAVALSAAAIFLATFFAITG